MAAVLTPCCNNICQCVELSMHCCETKTLAALLLPLNVTLTLSAGVCVWHWPSRSVCACWLRPVSRRCSGLPRTTGLHQQHVLLVGRRACRQRWVVTGTAR